MPNWCSKSNSNHDHSDNLIDSIRYFGIGVLGGTLGTLVGLGGGFVVIPSLVSFAKLTQHQAHGTSLAAVAATSLFGAATFGGKGEVDIYAAIPLSIASIATVSLGAKFSSRMNSTLLKRRMGFFMMGVAPLVPLKPLILDSYTSKEDSSLESSFDFWKTMALLGVGSVTGFSSGLFGVGGGSIMTPGLAVFTDLSQYSVIGTSLAAMVIPSCVGAFQHYRLGNLIVRAAIPVSLGTSMGAYFGGLLALQLPEQELRIIFAVLMLTLGFRQVRATQKLLKK